MSWTDEEIDNLAREGANAQSFEYDNAYFNEIEAALPINKKGKDFLWMGTALLFIVALTTGYFVTNSNENTLNGYNDQLASLELNNDKNNVDSKSSINDQALSNGNTELNNSNNDSNNTDLTSDDLANANVNVNTVNGQNSAYSSSAQNGSITKSTLSRNPSGNAVEQNVLAQMKVVGAGSDSKNNLKDPNKKQLIKLRADTKINNQKEFDVERAPITAGLDLNAPSELNQNLDRNLIPNALPMLGQLRPKAAFYVELNSGISQSLILPVSNTSTSFGGGFGVESYLGNFNLTTGLNFKFSNHDDLFLTRSAKFYGFGSTEAMDTYDFNRVYSIEMPISIGYTFGKHNVNIGVRPSVLIGARMKHQFFDNNMLLVRSSEENGLVDGGLKRFGVKPTLGYAYRMNNWTIGANIGVQLMESVDENFIKGVNNDFPIDGQIYLRRTIRLRR